MLHIKGIAVLRDERAMWPASSNVYLFRDEEGAILFDVGCGRREVLSRLEDFLRGEGFKLADIHTIILSHAHPDHMGAMRFLGEEISPQVLIHRIDRPLAEDPQLLNQTFDIGLPRFYLGEQAIRDLGLENFNILDYFEGLCPMGSAVVARSLDDGEILRLGDEVYEVILTPGHAPGHISLYRRSDRVLLSSDVLGEIVAWYSPSSGGARGFLESLDRLSSLEIRTVLPAHGEPIFKVREVIERTRRHLLRVEERIANILREGPITFGELSRRMYRNQMIQFFPGMQIIESHLIRMEEEGRIRRAGEGPQSLIELVANI